MIKKFNDLNEYQKKLIFDTLVALYMFNPKIKDPIRMATKRLDKFEGSSRKWHNFIYWRLYHLDELKKKHNIIK